MKKIFISFFLVFLFFFPAVVYAGTVRNVSAEGSCAIVEMTAEQCGLTALQRARASAIEQAAGLSVSSAALVTNMTLAGDFIKTYARGFIISEKAEWRPIGQYQKDKKTPPIPEYRVKIVADVRTPERKIKPLGVKARTNSAVYKNGDRAVIEVGAEREAKIAVFNITADDRIVMVFPNEYDKDNKVFKNHKLSYPGRETKTELIMQTLEGHKRDAEAFFVAGLDSSYERNFGDVFVPQEPMDFTTFFSKYAEIADYAEDVVIAYEVVSP